MACYIDRVVWSYPDWLRPRSPAGVGSALLEDWASVADAGPVFEQRWHDWSCLQTRQNIGNTHEKLIRGQSMSSICLPTHHAHGTPERKYAFNIFASDPAARLAGSSQKKTISCWLLWKYFEFNELN